MRDSKLLAMAKGLGIGPCDVQPAATDATARHDAERERRIREVFLESHAGQVIAAIEAGMCGGEMRRAWRRYRTVAGRCWPLTEKRKARKV